MNDRNIHKCETFTGCDKMLNKLLRATDKQMQKDCKKIHSSHVARAFNIQGT